MTPEISSEVIGLDESIFASGTLSDRRISVMDEILQICNRRANEELDLLERDLTITPEQVLNSIRSRANTYGWGDCLDH